MLKEPKPQSRSPTPSFNKILKPLLINLNILATVVEVIIFLTEDLLVTLDSDLVLTRACILVLDTMMNLTPITVLLITTVIDLDITNIITKTNTNHTLLHVRIIILSLLVVHLNITFVLVNAPLVIITPPLNDTTLLTALLLNHVTIAIVVDHIQTPRTTLNFNVNPLLILLTHLHHLFKVILLRNPNLKLICTNPLLLLHNTPHSPLNMLTLLPSTWFVNLDIFKPSEDTSLPSKLELLFLLGSGAPICGLKYSFLKYSKRSPHKDEFNTLTVANKAEVPISYNVILTLHTSIHGSTLRLVIPFAVANIKYNIHGTPF